MKPIDKNSLVFVQVRYDIPMSNLDKPWLVELMSSPNSERSGYFLKDFESQQEALRYAKEVDQAIIELVGKRLGIII